jgi:hypothetical protein
LKSELQRRCLDRGVVCSLDELTWTKAAGQIIDRICRYCSRISGPGH